MKKFIDPQLFAFSLIFLAIASRLLPHPANVAPITAIALLSSSKLKKWWAYPLPLIALFASDLFLGFYGSLMFFVYGSFALVSIIGFLSRKQFGWPRIIGASIISSVIFFLITNFGVWLLSNSYTKDLAGLISCYVAGIPFFRNTFIGDMFYTVSIFGLYSILNSNQSNNVQQHVATKLQFERSA